MAQTSKPGPVPVGSVRFLDTTITQEAADVPTSEWFRAQLYVERKLREGYDLSNASKNSAIAAAARAIGVDRDELLDRLTRLERLGVGVDPRWRRPRHDIAEIGKGRVRVVDPRCEGMVEPVGLHERPPHLSWALESDENGVSQSAYRILAGHDPDAVAGGEGALWDTGRVQSSVSAHVPYGGPALTSRERVAWRVDVWDEAGDGPYVGPTTTFEMGLLTPADWTAKWIRAEEPGPIRDHYAPSPLLRKSFDVFGAVRRARAYASALGLYRLFLNGEEVTCDALFRPGWTDYDKRIQYQCYDITPLIREGRNAVGLVLGYGWYAGYVGFNYERQIYGAHPQALTQIELEFEDGRVETIGTDRSWCTRFGPIIASDLQMGEVYDARLDQPDWTDPAVAEEGWRPAQIAKRPAGVLSPQLGPHVRRAMTVPPVSAEILTRHSHIYDFGQVLVGRVRIKIKNANAGREIVIRHAEALGASGEIYTANLRRAFSEDRYVCKGENEEVYEPSFTWHGFRYVEVWGMTDFPEPDSVVAIVTHTDLEIAGTFRSSSPLLNQIYDASQWTQRGNAVDVPTDCPQRNERLGWMADVERFLRCGLMGFDLGPFMRKWLTDIADSQGPDGDFKDTAPGVGFQHEGAPGWADCAITVPHMVARYTGDTRWIERHYTAMAQWVARVKAFNPDLVRTAHVGNDYGDWLGVPTGDESQRHAVVRSVYSTSPRDVLATAFFARISWCMADMARMIGRDRDVSRYTRLFNDIAAAYREAFVSADGRIKGETQTVYAQSLAYGLIDGGLRARVCARLVDAVERANGHPTFGLVGTDLVARTLAEIGRSDLADQMVMLEDYPSLGFMIRHGAGSIWERWDTWRPGLGFQDQRMNSFNHMALAGSVSVLLNHMAGIQPLMDEPTDATFRYAPRPPKPLEWIDASVRLQAGLVRSRWRRTREGIDYVLTTPANSSAAVSLRVTAPAETGVTLNGRPIGPSTVGDWREADGEIAFTLGSGEHRIAVADAPADVEET